MLAAALLVTTPLVLVSVMALAASMGVGPGGQWAIGVAMALLLPLWLGDKLLSWLARNAPRETEIRWLTATSLACHLLWLHGAVLGLGQEPRMVGRDLVALVQAPRDGVRLAGDTAAPAPPPPPPAPTQPAGNPVALTVRPPPAATKVPPPATTQAPPSAATEPRPPVPRAVAPRPRAPAPTAPRPAPRRPTPRAPTPAPAIPPAVSQLARRVTAGLADDRARLEAIHDWVARNIAYDVPVSLRPLSSGQDPATVLRKRMAVCGGYARLTGAMLEVVGIESRVASGWARWDTQTWAEVLAANAQPFHAWNEVLLDGRWVTVDTTWDAGFVDSATGTFQWRFSRRYLDPTPEVFAITHSQDRPATSPPDPGDYYFHLTAADRNRIGEEAFAYMGKRSPFRGKRMKIWSHGQTGHKQGSRIEALCMVQLEGRPLEDGCRVVRLQKRRDAWRPIGHEACPAEGWLPSGGYPLVD